MAAKRIAAFSVDWVAFAERVPAKEKANFLAFKSKSENYLRRVAALPDAPPKIDWNFYKGKVAVPGLVDNFQKNYETLTIQYPSDQGRLAEVEKQRGEEKIELEKFIKEMHAVIEDSKKKLAVAEAEIPYSEMSMEEYFIARPDEALFQPSFPTFWPHNEESVAYSKQMEKEGKLL